MPKEIRINEPTPPPLTPETTIFEEVVKGAGDFIKQPEKNPQPNQQPETPPSPPQQRTA